MECGTTYVGDDTGWIPPVLRGKGGMPDITPSCGCGCGCAAEPETVSNSKRLLIEYLYLDLNTCDRCIGTNLKSIYSEPFCAGTPYVMPENLKRFYEGTNRNSIFSCNCGCK